MWTAIMLLACAPKSPVLAAPVPPPTATLPAPVVSQPVPIPVGGTPHPLVGAGSDDPAVLAIMEAARNSTLGVDRLQALCDQIGHRLAGSPGLAAAVEWGAQAFAADGQESVTREPVLVPHWERGAQDVSVLAPLRRNLDVLTLGMSVGTDGPIEAPVVVITDEAQLGPHVAGKIVLYDIPMVEGVPSIRHYGPAVRYRVRGADLASAHGAVAVMVRSVTTRSLSTPHTGTLRYGDEVPRIPGVAVTTETAGWIRRLSEVGEPVRVRMSLGAQTHEDAPSHNVLAEIRGSTRADEIVLIGAHLDSWDVGQGAHDDGAGVAEVIEALRILRNRGIQPERTIRAVLFTNEENGLRGGRGYAETHAGETHVAAIESDLGGGWPLSWGASGTEAQLAWLGAATAPLGMPASKGGGGADISPLRAGGTLLIGLRPDDRHYFDVHHTPADTFDKIDPAAVREASGALAALAWRLAHGDAPAPVPPPVDAP